jgi:hypothetical protein
LRDLRLAAPTQLRLGLAEEPVGCRWEELPELTRAAVLVLLSRLIVKGVVSEEGPSDA